MLHAEVPLEVTGQTNNQSHHYSDRCSRKRKQRAACIKNMSPTLFKTSSMRDPMDIPAAGAAILVVYEKGEAILLCHLIDSALFLQKGLWLVQLIWDLWKSICQRNELMVLVINSIVTHLTFNMLIKVTNRSSGAYPSCYGVHAAQVASLRLHWLRVKWSIAQTTKCGFAATRELRER